MNARVLPGWLVTIALAGGVVASGFAQDGSNPSQTTVSQEKLATTASALVVAAAAEPAASPQISPQPAPAAPAVPANAAAQPPKSSPYASPWYYEIEALTKAHVEDGVVLAYIYNSAGTFNLTADQVVALKDLGAAPQVISAMMQHDRQVISGERPLTASTPPPFPPSVQAALEASLHPTAQTSAPPATTAPPPAAAPEDESGPQADVFWVEPDNVPDPPQGPYPVRLPYPVKLNDPIIMLSLPSFALPCR